MNHTNASITLTLTCAQTYLAGFPMLMRVEFHNVDEHLHISLIPFGLFQETSPVGLVLKGSGREWRCVAFMREGESAYLGAIDFGPNVSFAALEDVSRCWADVPPGHYVLSAESPIDRPAITCVPVPIEIRLPSKQDSEIAARLRRGMDKGKQSWTAFVEDSLSTPDVAGLSAAGHAQLDYYLFLHRATHGPQAIAELDPEAPWTFGHGILEGEAALLRLEILTAKEAPNLVGIEAAIVERWPGLTWRIEEIRKGEGVLKNLRRWATAYPPPPGTPLLYRK